jgi:hypothetical protein
MSASDSGLLGLSADVRVDRHRRTEEAGRNYSSATSSLPHRRCHQDNQAAEEPRSPTNPSSTDEHQQRKTLNLRLD